MSFKEAFAKEELLCIKTENTEPMCEVKITYDGKSMKFSGRGAGITMSLVETICQFAKSYNADPEEVLGVISDLVKKRPTTASELEKERS